MKKIVIHEDAEVVWRKITSDLSFAIYPKAMLIGREQAGSPKENRTLSNGMKLATYGFSEEKIGRLHVLDHDKKVLNFELEYANLDIAHYSMRVEETGPNSSMFLYDVKLAHGSLSVSRLLFKTVGMDRKPDKLVALGIEALFNL